MKKVTEENLKNAFSGESQANVKYLVFSEKAEKENYPNVARLFRANSYAEQVHATNHLRTLAGIGKTLDNIQAAIDGENFEVEEMYPAYIRVAEEQKEKAAENSIRGALVTEKVHLGLYEKAKKSVEKGKDLDYFDIFVCPVCGFTMEGLAPEKCPVCGTPKDKFQKF